jgi:hypothetical protein
VLGHAGHARSCHADRFPVLVILIAVVASYLVWHATRANQARLGIRSRRGQIRGMAREIRTFVIRGIVVLVVLILLLAIYLRQ